MGCWHQFRATDCGLKCDLCGRLLPLVSFFPVTQVINYLETDLNPPDTGSESQRTNKI